MIATRHAAAVSVLLAIALVPTVIHSYLGATADDGRTTSAIDAELAGLSSKPTERRSRWVKDVYHSDDWIERRYADAGGTEVLLFVARSYDLKRLYHHPELGVLRGNDFKRPVVERLRSMNNVPIHVLKAQIGAGVAMYGLLYDGRFVENPIALQLRTSFELLFGARKPMTLFVVFDRRLSPDAPLDGSVAAKVFRESVKSFLSQRNKA